MQEHSSAVAYGAYGMTMKTVAVRITVSNTVHPPSVGTGNTLRMTLLNVRTKLLFSALRSLRHLFHLNTSAN